MSPTAGKKRVKFTIRAKPGNEVFVAGTFNGWDTRKNRLKCQSEEEGIFSAAFFIPKGRHEYKFVIDGIWCVDPECPDWVPNEYGSLNSVLTVE